MTMDFSYILFLSTIIVIPTLIIILFNTKKITKYRLVILLSFAILPMTWLWDYFATKDGVWYFQKITEVWVLGIPIEEVTYMSFLILLVSSVTIILLKR